MLATRPEASGPASPPVTAKRSIARPMRTMGRRPSSRAQQATPGNQARIAPAAPTAQPNRSYLTVQNRLCHDACRHGDRCRADHRNAGQSPNRERTVAIHYAKATRSAVAPSLAPSRATALIALELAGAAIDIRSLMPTSTCGAPFKWSNDRAAPKRRKACWPDRSDELQLDLTRVRPCQGELP